MKAGKVKAGRRLIQLLLLNTTENSVAQAAWLGRNVEHVHLPLTQLSSSPEALAWSSWMAKNWDASLQATQQLLADQPFSSRPAIHGSFIASVVNEDWDLAITFARVGLRSNPDDVSLINNFIYSRVFKCDLEAAVRKIRQIDFQSVDAAQRIVLTATKGLVAFRSKNHELGRRCYLEAIQLARSRGEIARECLAGIYHAFEELRIQSSRAEQFRQQAIERAGSRLNEPWSEVLLERLREYHAHL